ncbi:MAG: proline--tRNA ligase, partial [Demequina sp.]
MSTLFLRTLREDPAEAEVASHKLLVRAGYIRRAAPGIYSWLPLGLRVLAKVEAVVREEMNACGAQEVHFPALLPKEPYEATGRWEEYGPNLFRLQDRKGSDMLLAPTHEEMFTLLVKDLFSSYKDLPTTIYQIQTKYRDEARPRAGLLRGREFIMKDAYSFDVDDAGLEASYQVQRDAYVKIFTRLGIEYVIVTATSGAMGGSKSEEFLSPTEIGEDTYVRSPGGYAANVEAVTTPAPESLPMDDAPAAHVEDTPDTPTIQTLVDFANGHHARPDRDWTAADTLKNVVLALTSPAGERSLLVVGVPGDRDADMSRLEAALAPAVVEAATDDDFTAHPGLVKGYIGPGALGPQARAEGLARGDEGDTAIPYLVDPRIVP